MFLNPRLTGYGMAATAVVALQLTGCTKKKESAPVTKAPASKAAVAEAVPTGPKSMTTAGKAQPLTADDQKLAAQAVGLLVKNLKVPKDKVEVDTVRDIEWRDSSLGCPKPDQAYMQVMTPGHKITLRVGKKFFFVHEANGRAFVCEQAKKKPAFGQKFELPWASFAFKAQRDLAKSLGVSPKDVRIANARKKTFEDETLGCPERGETAKKKGQVNGYVITLQHDKRPYKYHTDLKRIFVCPPISAD